MRKKIKTEKKSFAKYLIIGGMIISFIAGAFLTVETVSFGAELTKLEEDERVLISQNRDLAERLVRLSSATTLEAKASELGYRAPEKIVYVASEGSKVAVKLP